MASYQLYLGDCLDFMKTLDAGSVDAVITDPQYGIDFEYSSTKDDIESWYLLMNQFIPQARRISRFVVMPSCAINRLEWWYKNHKPDWLISWYKGSPGHAGNIGFNDWEPLVCYGKPNKVMHDYFKTRCGFDDNGHPCPKPIEWALWLVSRSSNVGDTIFDPFMGSGTTGVACMQLGRNFIGCEIDPGYYAIAEKRISEAAMQPQLFDMDALKIEATQEAFV